MASRVDDAIRLAERPSSWTVTGFIFPRENCSWNQLHTRSRPILRDKIEELSDLEMSQYGTCAIAGVQYPLASASAFFVLLTTGPTSNFRKLYGELRVRIALSGAR